MARSTAITGHKWFFSVPVADGFYTLAQTESGVSCLFVPRLLPDGSANRFLIQRLKDKCGNRSNASSEIEYHDTWRCWSARRAAASARSFRTRT